MIQRKRACRVDGVIVSDERQWGIAKIPECRAFAQKLRVHRHSEVNAVSLSRLGFECRDHHIVCRAWEDGTPNHHEVVLTRRSQC